MRYEIRTIEDADMTELGDVVATTSSATEAKELAADHSGNVYGAAILDTQEQTIDWGHAVTAVGEPAPDIA